jgi:hypothetical protein
VQWSIYHEGCDLYYVPAGKSTLDDTLRPIPELRQCYLQTQKHSSAASELLAKADDSELQAISSEASTEIPRRFELFVNFEWVAQHEKQLNTFRTLVTDGRYDQIRNLYKLAQSHNPNAVNLLSAVSNKTIREMVNSIHDAKPEKLQSIE